MLVSVSGSYDLLRSAHAYLSQTSLASQAIFSRAEVGGAEVREKYYTIFSHFAPPTLDLTFSVKLGLATSH